MARLVSVSLLCVALAGLAAAAANPARAGAQERLVTLETRAGVTQKFILITPQKPVAAVIKSASS